MTNPNTLRRDLEDKLEKFTFHGQSIPSRMRPSLVNYLVDHQPVGSFLRCVISNDLYWSVAHADDENVNLLPVYISFLYNEAPSASWGSPEAYSNWIKESNQ